MWGVSFDCLLIINGVTATESGDMVALKGVAGYLGLRNQGWLLKSRCPHPNPLPLRQEREPIG